MFSTFLFFTLIAVVIHFLVRHFFGRYGLVDHPDGLKKMHKSPVPISGGLSFAICLVVFLVLSYVFFLYPNLGIKTYLINQNSDTFVDLGLIWIFLTSLILLSISLIDDFIDLPIWVRLFTQISCCLVVISVGDLRLTNLGPIFGGNDIELQILFSYLFTIFCVVGITNAFNWIDGLDGLFSFQIFIAALGMLILVKDYGIIAISLVAAFIPYTFMNLGLLGDKFKVFIGDHGAMMIGYMIAWSLISFSEDGLIRPVDALWCVCIVLLNSFRVMWKRYIKKLSVFSSDRSHIHHYFLDKGYSDNLSLTIVCCLTSLACGFGYVLYLIDASEWVSLLCFFGILFGWASISYLVNVKKLFKTF
ncbi:hypothetical protein N9T42_00205 [SAR86 cluster bacterium]|nr:hypothetical protein [SAR86 cluster bacterium]